MRGLIVAGTSSNAGKTLVTAGLIYALKSLGHQVSAAKCGPDYIDPQFHQAALGVASLNLDLFAMSAGEVRARTKAHMQNADVLIVEGVMAAFDGAPGANTSTADLAQALDLPVLLVHDCAHQFQSAAIVIKAFTQALPTPVAGVILNKLGSRYHGEIISAALSDMEENVPVGLMLKDENLVLNSRHLGLVQAEEVNGLQAHIMKAAERLSNGLDLTKLLNRLEDSQASSLQTQMQCLPPLGQHIAIAQDQAFRFFYPHWHQDWCAQGAEISFFSPLKNEAPCPDADAVFLPGGYPELHAEALSNAQTFKAGMIRAAKNDALIYGECGGYMALGDGLIDSAGKTHEMLGLLPVETDFSQPKRTLGYRYLQHESPLPFPKSLRGHEFHYANTKFVSENTTPLFHAQTALRRQIGAIGAQNKRVVGSFAHVIGPRA